MRVELTGAQSATTGAGATKAAPAPSPRLLYRASALGVFITTIPSSIDASSLDFDPATMRSLFELGRARAATGVVWSRISAAAAETETTAPDEEMEQPSR